jgi:hypothetical protein
MKLLDIVDTNVEVSETGAFTISATIKAKQELFIFDDVPAVADGTIIAELIDGTEVVGTAKMVLPIYGVSDYVKIIGMGLSGAKQGKKYDLSFKGYKLWLMEK